ncbi:MAG: hypothetical protein IPL39_17495 [Opitutaceae bacterium]|nr:hypothetical protein [Opitutaceae bacterium]
MGGTDFWVCWTLREPFSLPGATDHFMFFRPPSPWSKVVTTLSSLEARINAAS